MKPFQTSLVRLISGLFLLTTGLLNSVFAFAGGEAGIISVRDQGHFYVGGEMSAPAENGSVQVSNQMFVGYQLPAEKQHSYPLVLVHGGGGSVGGFASAV